MTNELQSISGVTSKSASTMSNDVGGGMITSGVLLMIAGAIAAVVAFMFDVSVSVDYTPGLTAMPSSVANIDKISVREMILSCGGFSFVAGSILFAAGRLCAIFSKSVLSTAMAERAASSPVGETSGIEM